MLKPQGEPKTRFTVSALVPDWGHTDTPRMLGATLVFQHFRHSGGPTHGAGGLREGAGPHSNLWAVVAVESCDRDFLTNLGANRHLFTQPMALLARH